ncbi:MAG: hypothetical protein sL5_07910 [Candidatus Mesenet longicola]|uniref:Uncharacterized protein n=1 Tax=Candidatus Mesenet longicola TaxID=1892558 RepID=A0A8J3HT62_9RICK|nr:MAG: hypothetical protein sGL2_08550 [Candidatus Mesenet longicola]GHM59798.1 MAG: hypothetical protein sL5_07910 [Candidatus Mesenet longicola]
MLGQSSSRYKNVLNSPSQAAKIKNLDLFKDKIKEEIKKKNHCKSYLKPDSIKEYNKFSLEFRDFSLDMALLLLQDNAEVQTIKEKLIKLKNNTKGTHSIKSGKRTVYLQGEDIKAFEKRVERYIKYESMQCQVTYSKIEDSGDLLLHNVENAIYYIYHYFTKALDLQKKDRKKEAEKNKESETINSCEQTSLNEKKDNALENNSSNLSAKQDFLFDNMTNETDSSKKGIDSSCQDSSIDSTSEITLLKEQVNQLSRENTQLKNNQNNMKQQMNKDEINALLKSKSELEHKILQLQEQLADMESMKNIMSCMQEENRQL